MVAHGESLSMGERRSLFERDLGGGLSMKISG